MAFKLEDVGIKVGDVVTCDVNNALSGGTIFIVSENYDSAFSDEERSKMKHSRWRRDSKGKPISKMKVDGYVRLKPVFNFFSSSRGKSPDGSKGTYLVHHDRLVKKTWRKRADVVINKVDIVDLATKYTELGNLIKDLAVRGGMEGATSDGNSAHSEAQEKPEQQKQ